MKILFGTFFLNWKQPIFLELPKLDPARAPAAAVQAGYDVRNSSFRFVTGQTHRDDWGITHPAGSGLSEESATRVRTAENSCEEPVF